MDEQTNFEAVPQPKKSRKKVLIPIIICAIVIALGILTWVLITLLSHNKSSDLSFNLFTNDLLAVQVNDKWGFINSKGDLVITPQYDDCYYGYTDESPTLIAVQSDKKWGYIDTSGTLVIPYKYDNAYSFCNGRAVIKDGEKYGFIDEKGMTVISAQFDDAFSFGDNELACVKVNDKWGYIDRDGNYVINPQFDSAYYFNEGTAIIQVGKKWGLIDKKGAYIVNPQYDSLSFSAVDSLLCFESNDKLGFLNTKGEVVIPPQFDDVSSFYNDLAWAKKDKKYGFINKKGEFVISPQFDLASIFYGDVAVVKQNEKYGLIDKNGKFVVNPQFDNFQVGKELTTVQENGTWGFIKPTGEYAIASKYHYASSMFDDGFAVVNNDNKKYIIINKYGEQICNMEFDGIGNMEVDTPTFCKEEGCYNSAATGGDGYCSEHSTDDDDDDDYLPYCDYYGCLNRVDSSYDKYCSEHSYLE